MNSNRMATNLFHVQLFIFLSLSWTLAASLSLAHSQGGLVKRNPLSSVDLHSNPKLEDWDRSGSSSSRSSGYRSDGGGDGGENNSVSSLEELENKLDLILDSETREKALLQHFLHQTSSEDGNKGIEKDDQDNGTGKSRSSEEALSTISKPRRNPRRSLRHKLRQQQVHVRAGETNGEGTITSTSRRSLASQSPGPDRSRNRHRGPAAPALALALDGNSNSNSKDGNSESSSEMMGSLSMTQTPGTVDQELEFGKVMEDEEDGGDGDGDDEDAEGSSDSNSMKNKDKKEEEDDYKLRLGGSHGEKDDNGEDSSIIVKKLEENSKRMETMVVFLADLRNVLSEAVASQEKQVALRGEVVELREEIDYLRKEVQKLRTEQASHSSLKDPKLENKIHNDETTIQWLKESVKELRTGLQEVSSSVNVTGLVHLRQQWETEVNRVDGDLRSLRSDVESLKGNQARDDEAVLEIKGDIADLRTWHIKMGQKFLQEEQEQVITDSGKTEEKQWTSEKVFTDDTRLKLNFHLTDSVSNGKDRDGDGSKDTHRNRHNRKLKAEMANMENIIKDVVKDQTILHKRIVKLEKKEVKESKQQYEQQRRVQSQRSRRNLLYFNDQLSNEIQSQEKQGTNAKPPSRSEYGASNTFRINNLEKTLADYGNTVQHISDKVASLNELRESSTQLFTALEALETKYDERLTEMQTGLARMEASVSSTSITNDELREQQNLQSRVMQSFKKDFLGTRDQVQTNHLRLATVQSQLLKWGLKTCSDLSAESIQNIKIASLENRLQDSVRSSSQ